MASDKVTDEMIQVIAKHAMGDRSEFEVLKERFNEDFYWCADKSVAAALAYMIAKDELEAAKEEEEEPDVYDEVVILLKAFLDTRVSTHTTADEIFTLIYVWLDKSLTAKGWCIDGTLRTDITELFLPFIIKKSEV